jgi:hypothetical protein
MRGMERSICLLRQSQPGTIHPAPSSPLGAMQQPHLLCSGPYSKAYLSVAYQISSFWNDTGTSPQALTQQRQITDVYVPKLKALTPGSGAYLNEVLPILTLQLAIANNHRRTDSTHSGKQISTDRTTTSYLRSKTSTIRTKCCMAQRRLAEIAGLSVLTDICVTHDQTLIAVFPSHGPTVGSGVPVRHIHSIPIVLSITISDSNHDMIVVYKSVVEVEVKSTGATMKVR